MNRLFSLLTIFWISFLLCWITCWADCSSLANQVTQIRASLQDMETAAEWYNISTAVRYEWLWLGAINGINQANPYAQKAEELRQILAVAEQDYNNCLNNSYKINEAVQEVRNKILEILEEGDSYFNKWLDSIEKNDIKSARNYFMKAYTPYKAILMMYNDSANARDFIDDRFDIKTVLSDSFVAISVNLCAIWAKEQYSTVIQDALDLNNKDAKELNEICGKMTDEEADNLWCTLSYWENIYGYRDNEWKLYCKCEDWYKKNDEKNWCIKKENASEIQSVNNVISNNTNNNSITAIDNWYSKEYNDAYEFAYQSRITTMPTIEQANMHWEIIRAEIAKMLSNWVKMSLGRSPDTSKSCNFKDISWVKGDLYTAVIESCQLGIMWQWINEFRPFDKITKWEVATAVSRILWWSKYDWWEPFYFKHMDALKDAWVLNSISSPEVDELRWNVMVTLMKASNANKSNNNSNSKDSSVSTTNNASNTQTELVIDIKNSESKIIANQDSMLDTLVLSAKNWDVELESIRLKFFGDYSFEGDEVRLENNGRKITEVNSIDSDWYVWLGIKTFYQKINNGDSLNAKIMIKTNIPSWKKLWYTIDSWTYSDNVISSHIDWDPKIYES